MSYDLRHGWGFNDGHPLAMIYDSMNYFYLTLRTPYYR
jgi:hypothetical protein